MNPAKRPPPAALQKAPPRSGIVGQVGMEKNLWEMMGNGKYMMRYIYILLYIYVCIEKKESIRRKYICSILFMSQEQ
jgi:hypothetical protein